MSVQPYRICRGCLGEVNSDGVSLFSEGVRRLYEKCTYLSLPDPTRDALSHLICSDCYTKCQSWLLFKTICNDNEHQFESVEVQEPDQEVDLCPTDGSMEEIRLTIDEEDDEDEEIKDLSQDNQSPTSSKENLQFYAESAVCPVCYLLFPDTSKLNVHLRGHLSTEDPKCPICNSKFSRSSKVLSHIRKVHVPGAPLPTTTTTTKRKKVSEECDNSKLMDTSDDDKGISMNWSQDALDQQSQPRDNNSNKNTHCPLCEEVYTNSRDLSIHLKVEHLKERDVHCPMCPASLKSIHGLVIHIFLMHTNNKWKCSLCPLKLECQSSYVAHMAEHSERPTPPPWNCRACGTEHPNYACYRKHLEDDHWAQEKKCFYCTFQLQSVEEFVAHIVKAHTPGKWDCTSCALGFDRRSRFEHHLKHAHFYSGHNEITVQGELRCLWCPDLHFNDYATFKGHIFRDHSEGKFVLDCGQCEEPLADGMQLLDHLLESHLSCTLACNNCEYQDRLASHMESHLDQVHKIGKTGCTICGQEVRLMADHLEKHSPKISKSNGRISLSIRINKLKSHQPIHKLPRKSLLALGGCN